MVERIKNGVWRVAIDRVLPDGTRLRSARTFQTEKAAKAWQDAQTTVIDEAALRQKLGVDKPLLAPPPTLRQFHDRDWWPNLELKVADGEASSATLAGYRSHMKKILRAMGHLPLDKVDGAALDAFRLAHPKTNIRPLLVPLSALLKLACARGKIPGNPLQAEGLLRSTGPTKAPRHHSLADVLRLINAYRPGEEREQLAVALAGLAGLRMGEVRGLRVADIHGLGTKHPWLAVEHNIVRGLDNAVIDKDCKAGRGRKVPVCATLAALLSKAVVVGEFVVGDEDGPMEGGGSRTRVQRLLRKHQTELELPGYTFHELRKAAVFWWEDKRVEPWNISYWAGHGGQFMARVTRDHYSGAPVIDWTDAAKILPV